MSVFGKNGKKSIVLVVLLAVAVCFASAQSILECMELGTVSRSEFNNDFSDAVSDAKEVLNLYLNSLGASVERIYQVDSSNVDAEDQELLDGVANYLSQNYNLQNGSSFATIVSRGDTDGWLVCTNFGKKDYVQYLFYFNAQ